MSRGRIESVNTSRGGLPKTAVFEAFVSVDGVDGDRQRDRRFHGGRDRAVVLFSMDVIRALQSEGHPIAPGSVGENLTVSGLDWSALTRGTRLSIGEVVLEITEHTEPCRQIARYFTGKQFQRIDHELHPGSSRVCARVLSEGIVRMGDPVVIVSAAGQGPQAPHTVF